MVLIVYHKNFVKSAKLLPKIQQEKLAELLVIFQQNPFHPTLHAKHLSGELAGLLSFRITRDWRVVFQFLDHQTIQLLQVKHRKDIYQ